MSGPATIASREESSVQLQERGGECRLLNRLLAAPPDSSVFQDVKALGWLGGPDPGLGADHPELEAMEVEYSRLFSVPGPDMMASHQSVYTDVLTLEPSPPDALGCGLSFEGGRFRGFLGGESCSEARRWYKSAGFEPPNPAPAMADHISSQLAFLEHLYLAQARALEAGELDEARTLAELRGELRRCFLDRWVQAFGSRLAANVVSQLYRRVGRQVLEVCAGG